MQADKTVYKHNQSNAEILQLGVPDLDARNVQKFASRLGDYQTLLSGHRYRATEADYMFQSFFKSAIQLFSPLTHTFSLPFVKTSSTVDVIHSLPY